MILDRGRHNHIAERMRHEVFFRRLQLGNLFRKLLARQKSILYGGVIIFSNIPKARNKTLSWITLPGYGRKAGIEAQAKQPVEDGRRPRAALPLRHVIAVDKDQLLFWL